MARKVFLLLFCFFITVVENPLVLSATDKPQVIGINSAGIVQTVPLPDSTPESGLENYVAPSVPMAGTDVVDHSSFVSSTPVEPIVPIVENFVVTYQVASAKEYNELAYDLSYSDIYKFRKMVYGHNTSNLLLNLVYKNINDVIAVTENGVTTQYRIMSKHEMLKISANELQDIRTGQVYAMKDISWALNTYELAFETCSGYGDTPYRWVLFANRV